MSDTDAMPLAPGARPRATVRAALTTAGVGLALLVGGCGGSGTSRGGAPLDVVRAAGDKVVGAGSSRFLLTSLTTVGPQKVTFTGDGAFDYAGRTGTLDLKLDAAGGRGGDIQERITGGNLYLSLPTMPGIFYKLALSDVGGTSLGSSTDPSASFAALKGAATGVTKVGIEQVRGASTTHYKGTIDVKRALDQATGLSKQVLEKGLASSGLTSLPFEAYVDDQGRLRKYIQVIEVPGSAKTGGKPIDASTTVELYDFGTKVDVQVPAADKTKDGAPLLRALKGGPAAG